MHRSRVLLVGDIKILPERFAESLRAEKFDVVAKSTHELSLAVDQISEFAIVVVATRALHFRGSELCRQLRFDESLRRLRIVVVAEQSDEADELVAFALGVDDYVRASVGCRVLVSRLRALVRRTSKYLRYDSPQGFYAHGGISVDTFHHQVLCDDWPVSGLTTTEFRLLVALVRSPGRLLSREQLARLAFANAEQVPPRSIDVRICRLRRKLGDKGKLIRTVRAGGYTLGFSGVEPEGFPAISRGLSAATAPEDVT